MNGIKIRECADLGPVIARADHRDRADFLAYLNGKEGDYSGFDVAAIVAIASGVVTLGSTVYGIIRQRNAGWYSWDEATRQANLRVMLTTAFEESRKTSKYSAAQLFWQALSQYDFKDDGLAEFLNRSGNAWVKDVVADYEKKYGFGFDEVTPIDWKAFPLVMLAVGLVVGFIVYKIIQKLKK